MKGKVIGLISSGTFKGRLENTEYQPSIPKKTGKGIATILGVKGTISVPL
jgi:hypothetical protein